MPSSMTEDVHDRIGAADRLGERGRADRRNAMNHGRFLETGAELRDVGRDALALLLASRPRLDDEREVRIHTRAGDERLHLLAETTSGERKMLGRLTCNSA
jgi:hypothetical protein